MKLADKKMKGNFWEKIGIGSKSERFEEAVELCKQAATSFKLQKRWEDSTKAYLRCAEIEKMNKSGEASDYLLEAANMQKKYNIAEAVQSMLRAADLMCNDGKISQAARVKKQIAEIYEADSQPVLACKYYKESVDLYQTEGENQSTVNSMLLKVAELTMMQENGDVPDAIKIYEKVGDKYLEHKLTAPSARDLFFRACLLHLVIDDTVGAETSMEKYTDKDPSLSTTREFKFVRALVKVIEEKNLQEFSDQCFEFNSTMPLDKWKTTILNRIKTLLEKSIKNQFSVV